MSIYLTKVNELSYLTDDAEITKHPEDPVVVGNGDYSGIVTFEIKAYPPPTFEFCYNEMCSVDRRGRVQFKDYHNDDETVYKVEFIVHNMSKVDNGNVTLRVTQTERGVNFNHTVMLFLPCKFVAIQCDDVGILWEFLADF